MPRANWVEPEFYEVVERLRRDCLTDDGSLFTPGAPVWTRAAAQEWDAAISEFDLSDRSFGEKLRDQLAGLSSGAVQFAAESLYVALLPEADTGDAKKLEHVRNALSMLEAPVQLDDQLRAALRSGIATYGQGGRNRRGSHLRYLASFTDELKSRDRPSREALLSDPSAFRAFAHAIPERSAQMQREALLHLLFPDEFESTVSVPAKRRIVEAFSDYVEDPSADVDAQLASIREGLGSTYPDGFSFWDDEIRPIWSGDSATTGSVAGWIVRGERAYGTNLVPRWLAEGFVSMGAPPEGEITPGMTTKEIMDQVLRALPDHSRNQLIGGANAGRQFASEIAIGDWVMTRDGPNVYAGRITSEQTWHPDGDDGTARRRTVDWVNSDQPLVWAELPESLRKRATNPNTVWNLKDQAAVLASLFDDPGNSAWSEYLEWAEKIYSIPSFDAVERDYKLEIAAKMAEARRLTEASGAMREGVVETREGNPYIVLPVGEAGKTVRRALQVPTALTFERPHSGQGLIHAIKGNRETLCTIDTSAAWKSGAVECEPGDLSCQYCEARLVVAAHDAGTLDAGTTMSDYARESLTLTLAARAAEGEVVGSPDWISALKRAFGPPNNLTRWQANHDLLSWCSEDPESARAFLLRLWAEPDDLSVSLADWPLSSSPGDKISLASLLLLGVDPAIYPVFRSTVVSRTRELLDLDEVRPRTPNELAAMLGVNGLSVRNFLREKFPRSADEKWARYELDDEQAEAVIGRFKGDRSAAGDLGAKYAGFIAILDEIMERLAQRGTELRDRLDAQSIAWWLVYGDPPAEWSEEEQMAFREWRGDSARPEPPVDEVVIPVVPQGAADALYVPQSWLQEIVDLLNQRRQIVFYGPPGTGKTYIAQRLGELVESAGGSFELVQFHPTYSYEDFFEGFRPVAVETATGVSYALRPGPLRLAAKRAIDEPSKPHVLVIDELNRGNVAKIFGELFFLLEYRDRAIPLQYSPEERFALPRNLFFIGTMNTADRSIALVDSALRRRFYFRSFLPTEPPLDDVLGKWLHAEGLDPKPALLLRRLNEAIGAQEFSIGPSYFMAARRPDGIDLDRVWRFAIKPLLEEHYYGTGRSVEEFSFAALARQNEGVQLEEVQPEDEEPEDGEA